MYTSKISRKHKDNHRDKKKDESKDKSKDQQSSASSIKISNHDQFWKEYVGEDWDEIIEPMNIRRAKRVQQIPKSKSQPKSILKNLPAASSSDSTKSMFNVPECKIRYIQDPSKENVETSTRSSQSSDSFDVKIETDDVHGAEKDN